jgi:AraC-like DNA-binding protein
VLLRAGGDWIRSAPAQPGIERIAARFGGPAYAPHRHDTYAIGYTVSGVQCFDYRGRRADSLPGHAIVLYPDELHDGRAGDADGFVYRMLYLAPATLRAALDDRTRALPFVPEPAADDPVLLAALRPALADLQRPLEPLELDAAVERIGAALLRRDRSARGKAAAPACVRAVGRARDYLDAHDTQVVGSDELEAASGLGRYELARQFRRQLGTSPYRYLTMRRLERVQRDMRAGASLSEAALAAGFADQSHMTRRFRNAYGLSPGRWRALQAGSS